MTVAGLIERLVTLPSNMNVVVMSDDRGDCTTQFVPRIVEMHGEAGDGYSFPCGCGCPCRVCAKAAVSVVRL